MTATATATATRLPTYSEIAQGAYSSHDTIPVPPPRMNDNDTTIYDGDAPIAHNVKHKKHKLERQLQQPKNGGLSNPNANAVKNYFAFMNSVGRTQMLNSTVPMSTHWSVDEDRLHLSSETWADLHHRKRVAKDRLNKELERMG